MDRLYSDSFIKELFLLGIIGWPINGGQLEGSSAGANSNICRNQVGAYVDIRDFHMIVVPEQENTSPGTYGRAVCERSESEAADVRGSVLVDVIEFGFLNARNVTQGIRQESMNCVLPSLIIQTSSIPVRNGKVWSKHDVDAKVDR
jgi:hypothetical protein